MKKLIALLLALVLCVASLSACTKKTDTGDNGGASGDDDQIVAPLEPVLMKTVGLPDPPAGPIAVHSAPQLHAGGDAQPVFAGAVFAGVHNDKAANGVFTLGIESAEDVVLLQGLRKFHLIASESTHVGYGKRSGRTD